MSSSDTADTFGMVNLKDALLVTLIFYTSMDLAVHSAQVYTWSVNQARIAAMIVFVLPSLVWLGSKFYSGEKLD